MITVRYKIKKNSIFYFFIFLFLLLIKINVFFAQKICTTTSIIQSGKELMYKGDYVKLISLYNSDSIIQIIERSTDTSDLVLYHHIFAQALNDVNDPYSCIEKSLYCLKIIYSNKNPKQFDWTELYLLEYLIQNHQKTKDHYRSNKYCHIAISKLSESKNSDFEALLSFSNSLALNSMSLNDNTTAKAQLIKCLSYLNNENDELNNYRGYIYQNLSKAFLSLHQLDSSLYYLEKSIELQERRPDIFQPDYFSLYATAANRYLIANDQMTAESYFALAKENYLQLHAPPPERSHYHQVQAKLLFLEHQFEAAHLQLDTATHILGRAIDSIGFRTPYPNEYFSLLDTRLELLKSKALYDSESASMEEYATKAIQLVLEANQLLGQQPSHAIKRQLIRHIQPLYAHYFTSLLPNKKYAYRSAEAQEIFNLYETFRAQLINEDDAIEVWMQEHLTPAEQQSHHRLTSLYDSLVHAAHSVQSSIDLNSPFMRTNQFIYHIDDSLRAFFHHIRKQHPVFDAIYRHQASLTSRDIETLFERFDQLILFFEYENNLIIIQASQDEITLHQPLIDSVFYNHLQRWNDQLRLTPGSKETGGDWYEQIKQFHKDGNYLYSKLMVPLSIPSSEKILIIPDGSMTQVAFSALNQQIPTSATDYSSANYLATTNEVTIQYSLRMASFMIQRINKSKGVISFVPQHEPYQWIQQNTLDTVLLSPLPFTDQEGQYISRLFEGELYNEGLPVEQFLQVISNKKLLHIGAHVVLDDLFSGHSALHYLSPAGDAIHIKPYEIAAQSLNTDLVVVNSCHAGHGEASMGNGIQAFISGFAHADVKSILTSRWQVNDKIGYEMMTSVADNLDKGLTAQRALQEMQRQQIALNDPLASHPSYWASYYLIGDPDVIIVERNSMRRFGVLAALLLVVAALLYRHKSKIPKIHALII